MELLNYWKLIFLGCVFILTVILSFHPKIKFYKNWIATLPSILITALVFIFWDVKFANAGIWNFHTISISVSKFAIPLEEIVFYFVFPFAGFLIYGFSKSRSNRIPDNALLILSLVLMFLFGLIAYLNKGKLYTLSAFMFTFAYLAYTIFRNRFKTNYIHFYLSYFILMLPYLLYLILPGTASITDFQTKHIIGFSILTIPIENFVRLFLMILMNFTLYEYFLVKRKI